MGRYQTDVANVFHKVKEKEKKSEMTLATTLLCTKYQNYRNNRIITSVQILLIAAVHETIIM